MIRTVDFSSGAVMRRLLRQPCEAYRRERQLVGCDAIPALGDTPGAWRAAGEGFRALFRRSRPLGMISRRRHGEDAEICRLIVHPRTWRFGVASRLRALRKPGPGSDGSR